MNNLNRPWENEPNRVEFKYKGYHCLINRVNHRPAENPKDWLGHLCGYVALPKGHPFHGKPTEEIDVEVHGGLTYARKCEGEICHVPKDGEDDNVFWIGFDCAHFGDLIPGIYEMRQPGGILHDIHMAYGERSHEKYKSIAFVKNEIRNLVKQLEKAA